MSREVPYDKDLKCDNCGKIGASDFMGDYYCPDCVVGCKNCGTAFIIDLSKPRESQTLCHDCLSTRHVADGTQEVETA